MAVNLAIKSTVFDIATDTPSKLDHFFVDSNVWYWMTYSSASSTFTPALPYQIKAYPNYIKNSLQNGSNLLHCNISLLEITSLIERMEHEIYKFIKNVTPKEYRHNEPVERARVVKEISSAWGAVKSMSKSIQLMVDDSITQNIEKSLGGFPMDANDYFILEFLKENAIDQIITDDGDFSTVPGLKVFTANRNVINIARVQGKLKVRKT